ncbi:MAG: hypothetical protein V3T84_08100 [Phycisphaerales bacterium]
MEFKHLRSHHGLAKRFGIDEAECRSLIDAIDNRRWMVRTAPSIVSVLASFGWMMLFGHGTDALEETVWDILGFANDAGFLGFMMALLLGFGVAITLAVVSGLALRRYLLRRQFCFHLFAPACFWCGYLLKGLGRDGDFIQCPECGRRSRRKDG